MSVVRVGQVYQGQVHPVLDPLARLKCHDIGTELSQLSSEIKLLNIIAPKLLDRAHMSHSREEAVNR